MAVAGERVSQTDAWSLGSRPSRLSLVSPTHQSSSFWNPALPRVTVISSPAMFWDLAFPCGTETYVKIKTGYQVSYEIISSD